MTSMVASPVLSDGSGDSPAAKPRMLVLCFDGTTNEFDGDNTNVVKLFAMLKKDCESEQLCYYQTGVGTYTAPGIFTPLALWVAKILDEAVAWYLDAHVMGGYRFLMQNYRCGDKICLFGFSRGAYTARALAGMLTKVGLLPRDNDEQVTFAYKMFTRTDKQGLVLAEGFKQTFSRAVEIEFLGVWDTVASTGVIMSRTLPFTTDNASIKTFRHALSLDEHRAKFVPTFYHWTAPSPQKDAVDPERTTPGRIPVPKPGSGATGAAIASAADSGVVDTGGEGYAKRDSVVPLEAGSPTSDAPETHLLKTTGKGRGKSNGKLWSILAKDKETQRDVRIKVDDSTSDGSGPDVKEVWFIGCHSDVGGGEDKNEVTTTLADIPLRWMVREIVASQCGIQFDSATMERLNVHIALPNPIADAFHADATTTSNLHLSAEDIAADKRDALQAVHDSLKSQPLWWLLEIIPLPFTWQDKAGAWKKKWAFHLGSGRYVNKSGDLLFHETVRVRMGDKSMAYTPRAKYTKGSEKYVW